MQGTYRVHVESLQVIRVCVIRLLRTARIQCARNLKELLLEVRVEPTWRYSKGPVCAMSRPPIRNLVRLNLRPPQLHTQCDRELTPYLTHLSQERDEIFRTPPRVLVHGLPVVVVRGRRAHVYHDCQG